MCGGTWYVLILVILKVGLSPRVRGNQRARCVDAVGQRSIPACAGEPARVASPLRTISVYPRVCGGTQTIVHFADHTRGLSPRVRGNRIKHNADHKR